MSQGSFGSIFFLCFGITGLPFGVGMALLSGNFGANINAGIFMGAAFGLLFGLVMATTNQRQERLMSGVTLDMLGQQFVREGYQPMGQVGEMHIFRPTSGIGAFRDQLQILVTVSGNTLRVQAPKRILAKL